MQMMNRTSRKVWAREVAKALSLHLHKVDDEFNWALAHEDNLSKTPSRAWPEAPKLMYRVDEGIANAIHVRVLNHSGSFVPEPLVTLKFKAPLEDAKMHVARVNAFLEGLDPRLLPSA